VTDPVGALPFRFGRKQKHQANQRVEAAMAPCRAKTVAMIPMAAGERIVAFARPGKPPGIAVLTADGTPPAPPERPLFSGPVATISKAGGIMG
jgi:hypothetical protein